MKKQIVLRSYDPISEDNNVVCILKRAFSRWLSTDSNANFSSLKLARIKAGMIFLKFIS